MRAEWRPFRPSHQQERFGVESGLGLGLGLGSYSYRDLPIVVKARDISAVGTVEDARQERKPRVRVG